MSNRTSTNAQADKAGEVLQKISVARFRARVWNYWKKEGRHELPWRKTRDPYKILVSEIMLQQTQVPRVLEKYKSFLKKFPTARALAEAPLSNVLKEWNGLGYNRRAKYLHNAAKKVVADFEGDFKQALEHPLPGVGPYTKSAVKVFAFNEPDVLIETNVRTAFIHHFYQGRFLVNDKQLLPLIQEAAKGQDPREWHWALMDYGSYLKKNGVRNNSRSAHYIKQSKFEGSLRQVRGAILRELHTGPKSEKALCLPRTDLGKLRVALAGLARDGLIVKEEGRRPEGSARREKWRVA